MGYIAGKNVYSFFGGGWWLVLGGFLLLAHRELNQSQSVKMLPEKWPCGWAMPVKNKAQ
jgi:hypothetical protein